MGLECVDENEWLGSPTWIDDHVFSWVGVTLILHPMCNITSFCVCVCVCVCDGSNT